jgi:hypothetical protein
MQIQPMMKAGSSRGKQGAVVHAMDVEGKKPWEIGALTKAMCGTVCGPRSAGWAHMPKEQINCVRCEKAIARATQAAKQGEKL